MDCFKFTHTFVPKMLSMKSAQKLSKLSKIELNGFHYLYDNKLHY